MEATTRPAPALQACKSCKDRKRRCDKALPKCSLKNLRCDYRYNRIESNTLLSPASPAAPTAIDTIGDSTKPELPPLTLSSILFLDPTLLQHGPLQVQVDQHGTQIPGHISAAVGSLEMIQETADKFFETIHPWMPILSRVRFYDVYLRDNLHHNKADVVLLLLVLRLIISTPIQDPRLGIYDWTKQFYQRVEGSGTPSILVLQANIFIAIYELGHGLYPNAYMTIGTCARYMYVLGINGTSTRNVNMNPPRPTSLIEVEERRRAWWAVVILDRFVSIAAPTRPFATPDPELDDLLPVDDEDWNNGIVNATEIWTVATPSTKHMSKFSLLCQAARVLGKVICFLNRSGPRNGTSTRNGNEDVNARQDDIERIQLDTTLQAMLTAAMQLDEPDLDTITFIYGTTLALYTPHLSSATSASATTPTTREPILHAPTRASELIAETTDTIYTNLLANDCLFTRDAAGLSPWRVYFAYRTLGVHMRTLREARSLKCPAVPQTRVRIDHDGEPEETVEKARLEEIVGAMKAAFEVVARRWRVGGMYLRLLEAQEVLAVGA
ncbi:fungal-specific transcription factor domain-containing protein [Aspergillus pseudodeflectus]|uniref:Fungal-specific transcription factor domain-containing protein n=1 Tax=Aspergillus pseudodeflectus TaxID=176178 RepID=A0ABR4KAJ7_9EURO